MPINYRLIEHADQEVLSDFRKYLTGVCERFDHRAGINPGFKERPGIAATSEFAEPNIPMAARYNYIANDLANNKRISDHSKVLNILTTHLYGGHECPRVFSGELDRELGFVEFERIAARDLAYIASIRDNIAHANRHGLSVWDKWGMRVSVQSEGNKFAESVGSQRGHVAALEWMASWIDDGTVDRLLEANSFRQTSEILSEKRGIGNYIAYHCAAGLSPFSSVCMSHSEPFVLAGPGAVKTAKKLFPGLRVNYNELCVAFAEQQDELLPDLSINEHWQNVTVNGREVYPIRQDRLFALTSEIALCQYGVFTKARADQKTHARRQKGLPDIDRILAAK